MSTPLAAGLALIDATVAQHNPSHVFALFSGGHDSLCAAHIASHHPRFSGCVHVNTGIGVEETRTYVRRTCADRGWSLQEMHPDATTYDELVLAKGFPSGPASHATMYYWLKQRQIRRLVAQHKVGRHGRIVLVTGIRQRESTRRVGLGISTPVRRDGAQVWVQPILEWAATDRLPYMAQHGLPRNPVVDVLHKSGECLCGAFSAPAEFALLEAWFPATAERIRALEQRAIDAGVWCRWATPSPVAVVGQGVLALGAALRAEPRRRLGPLCSSCAVLP